MVLFFMWLKSKNENFSIIYMMLNNNFFKEREDKTVNKTKLWNFIYFLRYRVYYKKFDYKKYNNVFGNLDTMSYQKFQFYKKFKSL